MKLEQALAGLSDEQQAAVLRETMRSDFIERYLCAVAQGGKVASIEFDVGHAGRLFDAIYPAETLGSGAA